MTADQTAKEAIRIISKATGVSEQQMRRQWAHRGRRIKDDIKTHACWSAVYVAYHAKHEGTTYAALAKALGIPLGTFNTNLLRARRLSLKDKNALMGLAVKVREVEGVEA